MLSEMMIDLLRFLIKSRGIVNKRCCQNIYIRCHYKWYNIRQFLFMVTVVTK